MEFVLIKKSEGESEIIFQKGVYYWPIVAGGGGGGEGGRRTEKIQRTVGGD